MRLYSDFKRWVVDHSRGFRTQAQLLNRDYLRRFSRRGLTGLRGLSAETLEARLGDWLTVGQRDALLARRDLIVSHAEDLITELGEEAVLY
mgnify:CR=1 FL=1